MSHDYTDPLLFFNKDFVIDELKRRKAFTPDFWKFRNQVRVPVMIYDSLRAGKLNHHLIKLGTYHGKVHTVNSQMAMKRLDKTTRNKYGLEYRIKTAVVESEFIPNSEQKDSGRIRGELWTVSPESILELDEFYLAEGSMERVRKQVWLEEAHLESKPVEYVSLDGEVMEKTRMLGRASLDVFMYVGNCDLWVEAPYHGKATAKRDIAGKKINETFYESIS